jgi:hypothetical protein
VSIKHSGGEHKTLISLVQNTQVVSLKHSGDFPESLVSQGDRTLSQKNDSQSPHSFHICHD